VDRDERRAFGEKKERKNNSQTRIQGIGKGKRRKKRHRVVTPHFSYVEWIWKKKRGKKKKNGAAAISSERGKEEKSNRGVVDISFILQKGAGLHGRGGKKEEVRVEYG